MKASSCYCIRLRRAAGTVTDFYDSKLAAAGVTVNQFSLLKHAARLENCSVSKLANAVGLERTTLVRSLKPLVAAGLIEDTAEPGKRDRHLKLTYSGVKAVERADRLWGQAQWELEQQLGKEGLIQFLEALDVLQGINKEGT